MNTPVIAIAALAAAAVDEMADALESVPDKPFDKPWDRRKAEGKPLAKTPPGLIRQEELPAGWGLLELHGERIYKISEAKYVSKDHRAEMGLLVSALRRLDGHGPGVSVKHYVYDSKNRAVVIAVRETQTCPSKEIVAAKRDASPAPEAGAFPATAVPVAGGFPGQYAWKAGQR